eukprot:UN4188
MQLPTMVLAPEADACRSGSSAQCSDLMPLPVPTRLERAAHPHRLTVAAPPDSLRCSWTHDTATWLHARARTAHTNKARYGPRGCQWRFQVVGCHSIGGGNMQDGNRSQSRCTRRVQRWRRMRSLSPCSVGGSLLCWKTVAIEI